MLAVFNGICGTKVNTRHTVCAAFAPNRLAVLKLNVVQHTASYAFSASYAFVGGVEFVCGYDEFVKDRIYYAAFQSVRNADFNIGKGFSALMYSAASRAALSAFIISFSAVFSSGAL